MSDTFLLPERRIGLPRFSIRSIGLVMVPVAVICGMYSSHASQFRFVPFPWVGVLIMSFMVAGASIGYDRMPNRVGLRRGAEIGGILALALLAWAVFSAINK